MQELSFQDLMIQEPLNEECARFYELCAQKYHDFILKSEGMKMPLSHKSIIPNSVHLIWLGPKDYPQHAMATLKEWVQLNQDFMFYLWVDHDQYENFPIESIQVKRLGVDFCLKYLQKEYDLNTSYAAKSDILRLELLYEFGGFYTDYDNRCCRSLKVLAASCQFLGVFECDAQLNLITDPVTGEFLEPRISNCVIGSIKKNPAFPNIFEKMKRAHAFFEKRTGPIRVYQIIYATYMHLGVGVKDYMLKYDNNFLILPTFLGWRHIRGKRLVGCGVDPCFEINYLESVGWSGEYYDLMQFKNQIL